MMHQISDTVRERRDSFTGRRVDRLQKLVDKNPTLVLGRKVKFESFFHCYEVGEVVKVEDGNWLCINDGNQMRKENIVDVRGIYTFGYDDTLKQSRKHRERAELIRRSRNELKKAKDNVRGNLKILKSI